MKKTVLVTGASRGIGAAIAREFSRQGYFVYLLGRNEKNLKETASLCQESEILICDLSDPKAISATAQKIPHLDVLVNNAGIFERHDTLRGTDEIWKAQFEVNLMGPVRLTRALWPIFLKQKSGSIVNIASTLGVRPTPDTGSYSSIKAALINWSQSLAQEGGPSGIRVNCVAPGLVDTPIHDFHHLQGDAKEEMLKNLGTLQPLGRIGTPEEIAQAVFFLGSPTSAWTTGAVFQIDGGISLS